MGQEALAFGARTLPHPRGRRLLSVRVVVQWMMMLAVMLLATSYYFSYLAARARGLVRKEATWADPCYGGQFDCARLDVPMDWLDPSDDLRVVLAVIRLRATDRANYRGPIFLNPGGPGGSGVFAMLDRGALLQKVVGTSYDLISFDPRGVGASIPRIDCWSSAQDALLWQLQDVGVVDAHPDTVYEAYARMTAYAQQCETAMNASQILRHVSTASHARDMLAILDATGDHLAKPMLRYWGFSYGTLLGGTFASMYPDRVERLVSDGNIDYGEWYDKARLVFLTDADKVMQAFYDFCHAAGAPTCALHAASPAAVKARVDAVLQGLRTRPVVIAAAPDRGGPDRPEMVTYSRLQRVAAATLYQPQRLFPRFAAIVAALEHGDGRPLYEVAGGKDGSLADVCRTKHKPPTEPVSALVEGNENAFGAIMCADSVPLLPDDDDDDSSNSDSPADAFAHLVDTYKNMSRATGAVNALFPLQCVGRRVRAKWRYGGPYGAAATAFPILFVANIADNVTPLISARNNAAAFPASSSVVLVQQSYGHTSLSAPSTCTARAIRAYFQHGVVPAANTTCQPDVLPFGLPAPGADLAGADVADVADMELSAVVRELSERVGMLRL